MSGGHPFGADRSGSGDRTPPGPNGLEQKGARTFCPDSFFFDVRERIRTPDTLVRSQVLYPAELHTHTLFFSASIITLLSSA